MNIIHKKHVKIYYSETTELFEPKQYMNDN